MDILEKAASHIYTQYGELEIYTTVIIGVVVLGWIFGAIANKNIARTAFDRFRCPLEAQFANPGSLGKESHSHFFIYSTGRIKCSGQMISLHLSPRNDFLSRFVISWFAPSWYSPDKVVLEIFEPEIDPCISAFICRKYKASSFTEALPELKNFCKPFNGALDGGPFSAFSPSSLTGFTYLSNSGGRAIGQTVFGKSAAPVPTSLLKTLTSIFVSGESKSLKIELDAIPSSAEEWKDILDYSLAILLESLASIKLSDTVRAEVETQRSADAQKAARDADLARRKEDMQKQKEEQMKNLSAAEREKIEDKRRKKEQKRNLRTGRILL